MKVLAASLLALTAVGCQGGRTVWIGSDQPPLDGASSLCTVAIAAPPASLGLDPFYAKYLDAGGIPVLASSQTGDTALRAACTIVAHMVSKRDDVRQAMIANGSLVAVIAKSEVTTDIPEYRDLYTAFPSSDWNSMRGVGATMARPVSSCGEENLLCLADDPYAGEKILAFTFASAIDALGAAQVDSGFGARLDSTYRAAMSAGLWTNTWAAEKSSYYWGEGVESWFDANRSVSPPDGVHNDIATRDKLTTYDPALASLVADYLPGDAWRPTCP
jgi:hypothetical protein